MNIILQTKDEERFALKDLLSDMPESQLLVIKKRGSNREYIILHTFMDTRSRSAVGYTKQSITGYTILSNRNDIYIPYSCEKSMITEAITGINYLYRDEFRYINTRNITITLTES